MSYGYRVSLANHTTLAGGTLAKFSVSAQMELLSRAVKDGSEDALQFQVRFLDAKFVTEDPQVQKNFDELGVELASPMLFRLVDGRVVDPRRQRNSTPFAITLSRTLISALQVSLPTDPATATWKAKERDATGDYSVEYQRTATPGQVSKRKLEYDPMPLGKLAPGQSQGRLAAKVQRSQGFVRIEDGHLVQFQTSEVLRIDSMPGAEANSESTFDLELLDRKPLEHAPDWLALESELQVTDLATARKSKDVTAAYDSLRIGDHDFDTALAQLESISKDPRSQEIADFDPKRNLTPAEQDERKLRLAKQGSVFSAMMALLRTQPASVERALGAIKRGSPARRALLDALGAAGTNEAQGALVRLARDPKQSAPLRRAALLSLARVDDPSAESVDAMLALLEPGPLHQHALYGLGTLSRKLKERGHAQLQQRIAAALSAELKAAHNPAQHVHVLRAVANSGDASLLGIVKPFLTHTTPKVRGAAIDALRLMDHPSVDEILAERLLNDGERVVQAAVVEAMGLREPSEPTADALVASLAGDTKLAVKLKVVSLMGQWRAQQPKLASALQRIASESTVPKLRDAARKALES